MENISADRPFLQEWVLKSESIVLGVNALPNLFRRPHIIGTEQMDNIRVGSLRIRIDKVLTGPSSGRRKVIEFVWRSRGHEQRLRRPGRPVLTAVVVAGRIGSGIAAELHDVGE
jgi:hypothetical protein